MNQAFKAFLQRPTTKAGIATALLMQVVFSIIWMTGYSGVSDRIDQLAIAVVSEDRQAGDQLAQQLVQQLPFRMEQADSLAAARQELDEREVQMVVHIPADFTASVSDPQGKASLHYLLNESNPVMIKNVMSSVASQITAEANARAAAQGIQGALAAQGMPQEAAAAAAGSLAQRVEAELESMHVVDGMNNQMVPMMLVLASWVGAMIMALNFFQSGLAIAHSTTKWQRFGAQTSLTVVIAFAVSLVSAGLLTALGGQMESGFLSVWLFMLLVLLSFMLVAQMVLQVLGMAGMFLNIILLSMQLVSSGAMLPRELLPPFYHGIGEWLPATRAVEGMMSLLFGGPSAGPDVLALALTGAAALVVSLAAVALKKGMLPAARPAQQPQAQPEPSVR
ncbi:ABC transporter permease [Paenibacillus albicereus]|uniref:ABC transporter permease n=1 Tax=Paenibacillus albicereus TaxID=2726185 RepID=A0A6H2H2N0_9BACL|nr:ABC transporter permease [Paenibacillus albicereus]QJC53676.1 ABC transporter permease [Paenibacillus albicereus]